MFETPTPLIESAVYPSKEHTDTTVETHISPLRNMFNTNFKLCKLLIYSLHYVYPRYMPIPVDIMRQLMADPICLQALKNPVLLKYLQKNPEACALLLEDPFNGTFIVQMQADIAHEEDIAAAALAATALAAAAPAAPAVPPTPPPAYPEVDPPIEEYLFEKESCDDIQQGIQDNVECIMESLEKKHNVRNLGLRKRLQEDPSATWLMEDEQNFRSAVVGILRVRSAHASDAIKKVRQRALAIGDWSLCDFNHALNEVVRTPPEGLQWLTRGDPMYRALTILRLPSDIWKLVFSFSESVTVVRLTRVCKDAHYSAMEVLAPRHQPDRMDVPSLAPHPTSVFPRNEITDKPSITLLPVQEVNTPRNNV